MSELDRSSISALTQEQRSSTRSPFLRKPIPRPEDHGEAATSVLVEKASPSLNSSTTYNSLSTDGSGSTGSKSITSSIRKDSLERHLSLMDLVAIGVGGTIGSGLFVLAGLVNHEYAGPSAVFSWGISGLAALVSGCCYAELSGRIPLPGSAYAYCFVALGEWPAFMAATCLSIEYVIAAAAVARSWGDKCAFFIIGHMAEDHEDSIRWYLNVDGNFNPLAFCVSTGTVIMLLIGVKESKQVTNVFTILKVCLCFFMIIVGAFYMKPQNLTPLFPFGAAGMFRGATSTFMGYLGYDQLCALAGEASNPKRNLPLALMFTLAFVAVIYMTASLVLSGMQPWQSISSVSGFPAAFYSNDAQWAGLITAVGEVVTLPIVVLICIMAQPRLQYGMAEDGLLPAFFRKFDENGNLWNGTITSGSLMIFFATFVPFANLNDVISCAVLMALNLTDSCVILLWHEAPDPESNVAHHLVFVYHILALIGSYLLSFYTDSSLGMFAAALIIILLMAFPFFIQAVCPRTHVFGGRRHHYHGEQLRRDDGYFRTPLVPFLPFFGIFVNCYLIVQLNFVGIFGLLVCLVAASVYYFFIAVHHGDDRFNSTDGDHESTSSGSDENDTIDESTRLTKAYSLPEINQLTCSIIYSNI